jgi:hypothetical protein
MGLGYILVADQKSIISDLRIHEMLAYNDSDAIFFLTICLFFFQKRIAFRFVYAPCKEIQEPTAFFG